ncbi:MAG: GTPase Era [Rhodospirillaceae bacterium]|nr:GTPase Era [Rhodospirillaceae bacterium]|tara:strand:+ start:18740 stop:19690 length:951 start_codon:yes stop_codon:yes gene_type:complete
MANKLSDKSSLVPNDSVGTQRAGFVAVIGPPNAGKSTLVNYIVGDKITIVSPKIQTTRNQIRGICTHGNSQLVLIDTPGIFQNPRKRLERSMVHAAWKGQSEADDVIFLIDPNRGICPNTEEIFKHFHRHKKKPLMVINKVDTIKHEILLPLVAKIQQMKLFEKVFMISALRGDGVNDLLQYLLSRLPNGPWLYPEDQLSDISERILASEITREKIFNQLHQEIPYSVNVETEKWKELADGSCRIEQIIYVQRENHKIMILGKDGRRIKSIGKAAREELNKILERKIHLFLFVKVREGWAENPEHYRNMGLDYNPK